MRLRATRQFAISHPGRRVDPYGRQYLLDASSGMYLPGFNYSRPDTGPAWWLPQQDGSLASFDNTTLPRSYRAGRWGYEFHPGWTQLWPNANDMSLRSAGGLNPIVASGTGPGTASPAWALTENTTTGPHTLGTNPSYTAGAASTISVVARERAGSAKRFLLLVQTATGFGTNIFGCFDLATGAGVASAGAVVSAEQLADGYWRCNMTATATVTGASNTQVRLANSFAAETSNYTGNGAAGLDVWCANVTTTSYPVPLTFNDANPGIIGPHSMGATTAALGVTLGAAYSVGADYTLENLTAGYQPIVVSISDNTFNESVYLNAANLSALRQPSWAVIDGGVGQANSMGLGPAVVVGGFRSTALRVKENDFRSAFNGALSNPDTLGTLPTVDRLFVGLNWSGSAPNALQGRIHKLWVGRALTDAELADMTA